MLSEYPVGEADRIYNILTRDLGKLEARAVGVRKEASKLRGSIEPFSLASISFVKGRGHWRITSAEFIKSISSEPTMTKPLALIEKLVQGETSNPELFDVIESAVASKPGFDNGMLEIKLVSKILYHLGYLKETDLHLDKKSLVSAINEGIQASHL